MSVRNAVFPPVLPNKIKVSVRNVVKALLLESNDSQASLQQLSASDVFVYTTKGIYAGHCSSFFLKLRAMIEKSTAAALPTQTWSSRRWYNNRSLPMSVGCFCAFCYLFHDEVPNHENCLAVDAELVHRTLE